MALSQVLGALGPGLPAPLPSVSHRLAWCVLTAVAAGAQTQGRVAASSGLRLAVCRGRGISQEPGGRRPSGQEARAPPPHTGPHPPCSTAVVTLRTHYDKALFLSKVVAAVHTASSHSSQPKENPREDKAQFLGFPLSRKFILFIIFECTNENRINISSFPPAQLRHH